MITPKRDALQAQKDIGPAHIGCVYAAHLFQGRTFVGHLVEMSETTLALKNYYEFKEVKVSSGASAWSLTASFPFFSSENQPELLVIPKEEIFVGGKVSSSMEEFYLKTIEIDRADKSGITLAQRIPTSHRSTGKPIIS